MKDVSDSFQCFLKEAPAQSVAWMEAVKKLSGASALDRKTQALAYIAILSAVGLVSGMAFHVKEAKMLGASRDEIISAVLLPLPAVGNKCVAALPAALEAFDEQKEV